MSIDAGPVLETKLRTDTDLAALLGANSRDSTNKSVRPRLLRQGDGLPGITYDMISHTRVNGAGAGTDTHRARYQLNCWAATNSAAKELYDTTHEALKDWSNGSSDPAVSSCLVEDGRQIPDQQVPGRDKPFAFGFSFDVILWFNPNP